MDSHAFGDLHIGIPPDVAAWMLLQQQRCHLSNKKKKIIEREREGGGRWKKNGGMEWERGVHWMPDGERLFIVPAETSCHVVQGSNICPSTSSSSSSSPSCLLLLFPYTFPGSILITCCSWMSEWTAIGWFNPAGIETIQSVSGWSGRVSSSVRGPIHHLFIPFCWKWRRFDLTGRARAVYMNTIRTDNEIFITAWRVARCTFSALGSWWILKLNIH